MSQRYKPRKVLTFNWSAELAYSVGLLTTDGCLSSDRRHIFFTSQDIDQITNMQLSLKLKSSLGTSRNTKSEVFRLTYSNVQLFDWLCSLGLTPNKSLTLGSLKIPDEYFRDFLRGHLDGDGSITTYIDRHNTNKKAEYVYGRIFVRFISASETHLIWLHENIKRLFDVKGAFHKTKDTPGKNSMYIIKFGKKESIKLLGQLYYSDAIPCLTRKKSAYLDFLKTV